MRKRGAVICVVTAALAVLASSTSASAGSGCTLTAPYKALLVYLHAPTTPPSEEASTAFGGAKGTQCTDGPVSVQSYPNVSKTAATKMYPHEAKPGRGPCTRNYQYTGSNTTVTTNAKTNKSTQKTYPTAVDFCEKGNIVDEIVATLRSTAQYPHAESLEGAIMEALAK